MDVFLVVLISLFFIVEAVIEFFDTLFNAYDHKVVISFILGALGSVFFGIDLLTYLNMPVAINIPWLVIVVNALFLGILVSRYAGNVNGLIEILKGFVATAKSRL